MTKDIEVFWNINEDIVILTKDIEVFRKVKEQMTLIVSARQKAMIGFEK